MLLNEAVRWREIVTTTLRSRQHRFGGYTFTPADVAAIVDAAALHHNLTNEARIDAIELAIREFEKPFQHPWEAGQALASWQDCPVCNRAKDARP